MPNYYERMFCPKGLSASKNGVGKCRRENQGKICTGPLLQVRQRSSQVEAREPVGGGRKTRRAASRVLGGGKGRESGDARFLGLVKGVGRRKAG